MSKGQFVTPTPSFISQYAQQDRDVSLGIEDTCVMEMRRLISLPSLDPHRKLYRNVLLVDRS